MHFYLKDKVKKIEWVVERMVDVPCTVSLPKQSQQSGLGWSEASSQVLQCGLPRILDILH